MSGSVKEDDVTAKGADTILRSFESSLPISLLQTREAVMARFRPHLAAHGVTEQQWRSLRALAEHDELDATRLSEVCCIMMPSLSRILKSFEADGLIVRTRVKNDARRQVISLTDEGRALFEAMAPQSAEIYRKIEAQLGKGQIDTMVKMLQDMRTALSE